MSKTREYEGESITVRYDARRCIHAEECVGGLAGVFEKDRRPWIDPDQATAAEVARVIERCPTGALTYDRRDGEQEARPRQNVVRIGPDGPLYGHGDIEISDSQGRRVSRETRVALCRCGSSRHKPFCDGTHVQVGFADPGGLGPATVKPPQTAAGPALAVRLLRDGPLLLEGPFVLRGAAGGGEVEGAGAALCRCGGSAGKPFCDGTHRSIGFQAADPEGA